MAEITRPIFDGLPSSADMSECKDLADTFCDLRKWMRRVSGKGELTAAGRLLGHERRSHIFDFLQRVTKDRIRKNIAHELIEKLSTNDGWCTGDSSLTSTMAGSMSQSLTSTELGNVGCSTSLSEARLAEDAKRQAVPRLDRQRRDAESCRSWGVQRPFRCLGMGRRPGIATHSIATPRAVTATLTVSATSSASVSGARVVEDQKRPESQQGSYQRKKAGGRAAKCWRARGKKQGAGQRLLCCCQAIAAALAFKRRSAGDRALQVATKFCVPRSRHDVVSGEGCEGIKRLQEAHNVTIRTPRVDDMCEWVIVSGSQRDVEDCRQALEQLLSLPVGLAPLHKMTLGIPRASYGAFIGDGGATLEQLTSKCHVLVDIPRRDEPGHVTIRGHLDDCQKAKASIEEILRDKVQELPSVPGNAFKRLPQPLPPSFDLATLQPIRRCLFFPAVPSTRPDEDSLEVFLKFLDSTRTSCEACVFTMTDPRIARRLLDAHRNRNVRVRIISDEAEYDSSDIEELAGAGIEVRTDRSRQKMHHKFCILDDRVLMNGSFSWTQGACENHRENLMITNESVFLAPFRTQFEQQWREYAPPTFNF